MKAFKLGLIGQPVAHSVSPAIHDAALSAAGLVGSYARYDVATEELPAWVARVRSGELSGLNVTIPHKLTVAGLVDRLAGAAERLGAVNTLVADGQGGVVGHNTDVSGLQRALVDALGPGADLGGRAVALIGAGGAARAAALAALELGAAEVRVHNRTMGRAMDLVMALVAVAPRGASVRALSDPVAATDGAALLLQATSVGMGVAPGGPGFDAIVEEVTPMIAALAPGALVLDLVYRPEDTAWCAAARASGRRGVSGLGMLVHQAADAFALWTGVDPPRAPLFTAARAALAPSGSAART